MIENGVHTHGNHADQPCKSCPNCGSQMEESNYYDVMIYLWCNKCCECHPLEQRGEKFEGWEVLDERTTEEDSFT